MKEAEATARALNHTDTAEKLEDDPRLVLKNIKLLGGDSTDLDLILQEGDELACPNIKEDIQAFLLREFPADFAALCDQVVADDDEVEESDVEDGSDCEEIAVVAEVKVTKTQVKEADLKPVSEAKVELVIKPAELPKPAITKKKKSIDVDSKAWFELLPTKTGDLRVHSESTEFLFIKAKNLYAEQSIAYAKTAKKSKTNSEFIKTVLKSGTSTDKISCLALLIQEAPMFNFNHMETLLGFASTKNYFLASIDSITDLFITNLLPDFNLEFFTDSSKDCTTDDQLVACYFQDLLKNTFFKFITLLETYTKDTISHMKSKALSVISLLLTKKSEQEENLLKALINKLGDTDRKVASKATFLLSSLLIPHPKMKGILIEYVGSFLLRNSDQERACYYGITFMNQIIVTKADGIASQLITMYFAIFESLVRKLSIPTGDVTEQTPIDQTPIVKKDRSAPKSSKQKFKKLMKQKTIAKKAPQLSQLNSKMMSAILTGINRSFPYASDKDLSPHLDTLYKISHISSFNTKIQCLTLIFTISQQNQAPPDRYYRLLYSTLLETDLYSASRQASFLNLLYKSIKADTNLGRIQAVLKRSLQSCLYSNIPFTCAVLYIVARVMKEMNMGAILAVGEDHHQQDPDNVCDSIDDKIYDARKRDPLHANASSACIWELVIFSAHYHPTVKKYALDILDMQNANLVVADQGVNYDPLLNHTLQRFLDRFVDKAPKVIKTVWKGVSIMQPLPGSKISAKGGLFKGGRKRDGVYVVEGGDDIENGRILLDDTSVYKRAAKGAVNNTAALPVDEAFYRKFLDVSAASKPISHIKDMEGEFDGGESDLEEEEIWKAMLNSGVPKGSAEVDDDPEMDMDFNDEEGMNQESIGGTESDDNKEIDETEDVQFNSDEDSAYINTGKVELSDNDDIQEESSVDSDNQVSKISDEDRDNEDEDEEDMNLGLNDNEDEDDDDMDLGLSFNPEHQLTEEEINKMDGLDDNSESETEQKKGKKKRAPKMKLADKMNTIASQLGFAGKITNDLFASAEDFEKLLDIEDDVPILNKKRLSNTRNSKTNFKKSKQ